MKQSCRWLAAGLMLALGAGVPAWAQQELPPPLRRSPGEGLEQLDDHALNGALKEWVRQRVEQHGFQGLRPAEMLLVRVWRAETALNMGGLPEFFAGPAADELDATLQALSAVGAGDVRALVEEALALFAQGLPRAREQRIAQMEAWPEPTWQKIARLSDRYFQLADTLPPRFARYARANAAQLAPTASRRERSPSLGEAHLRGTGGE